jgi:hypothetical protein
VHQFVSSTDPVLLPDEIKDISLFSVEIELSLDKSSIERNNYTLLAFVGDVGALFSTFIMMSKFILF